jgi:YD repeat-containing protein
LSPGRGRPLVWQRTYNLQAAAAAVAPGPLGFGWTDFYAESLTIDGAGNATVTLGNGATVSFSPSGAGFSAPSYVNAKLVRNSDGTFTFTLKDARAEVFNASGQLIKQTDRHGYITSLAYDSLGNLASITDPAGRKLQVTISGGLVSAVRDPLGRAVSFSYDASSNLIGVTDVGGKTTTYSYDAQHQLASITDPRGNTTNITYDTSNRVSEEKSPAGRTITYAYAVTGGTNPVTTITLGDGNQIQEVFNPTRQLLSLTRGYGGPGAATWSFTYDPATLARTSIIDPAGNTTHATYDALGNLLTERDPLGRTTAFSYSPFNDPVTVTDPSGVTSHLTYDSHGTLLSISRPLNSSASATVT